MITSAIRRRFSGLTARFRPPEKEEVLDRTLDGYLVSQVIGRALRHGVPFLASRVGFAECQGVGTRVLTGKWEPRLVATLQNTAGIFNPTEPELDAFSSAFLDAVSEVDLLGVMRCPHEAFVIGKYGKNPLLTDISLLEPYFVSEPWSQYLEGKKVLVIHPFAESIRKQYESARERLFVNPKVLPKFELTVLRAPQTITGNSDGFASWPEALEWLKGEVAKLEFDAAIVGCGAYGMPIGAFIKRRGKACIHLGGATQILFGISGARWRGQPHFKALQTDAWRPPLEEERPNDWKKAEGGCYW